MRAGRCSIKAVTWKNTVPGQPDFYVPPNTRCLYSVLLMRRRKDLWGWMVRSASSHHEPMI